MEAMSDPSLPAWARDEAFPLKPDEAPFGSVDEKGKTKPFQSFEELKSHLKSGKGRLAWIWLPEHDRLVAPEEVPEMAGVLKKRRAIFAQEDEDEARRTLPITGLLLAYAAYSYWKGTRPFGFESFHFLVMIAFGFLYFTARPWWECRKARKSMSDLDRQRLVEEVPEARFDLWMGSQRSLLTVALLGLVGLVGLTQFFTAGLGIQEAGLDKLRYAKGEHWRLFTAAFMHGNVIHFILNASALWYLARRVEILARWPHLAAVFFLSIIGAGRATISWMPGQISVGISGVVCGLLGFLLVFETLHLPLVPRSARRRLLGILVSLVVIGALGFQFIDNAAHFGGLVTGALYAVLVFPKSSSPHRPVILKRDYFVGGVSLFFVALSGVGAVLAMIN
jgi:membrane associated rhomboid family serine protease